MFKYHDSDGDVLTISTFNGSPALVFSVMEDNKVTEVILTKEQVTDMVKNLSAIYNI